MKQNNTNTNDGAASSSIAIDSVDNRPELLADRSFWGIAITQFLGAFNDNLFKQIVLLLSVVAVGRDVQGWATAVFSLPFVVFSGFAGFLSDRFSKRRVIVLCKIAEIVIMGLGMIAFLMYDNWAAIGTWTVLFLMGTHSSFFGPGKYGILPEQFRDRDLPKANGIILMSTFLAIILGTSLAGKAFIFLEVNSNGHAEAQRLWICSFACIVIAIIGTVTSLWIRSTTIAQPNSKLTIDDWGLSKAIRRLLMQDRPLLLALLVSCVFWMIAGLVVPIVNRMGISQLRVDESSTSNLTAAIAIGIMLGSILAAAVFKKLTPRMQVTIGLWGLVASLLFLGCWTANGKHMFGYSGCFVLLIVMGVFAAVYAVPLQVFLQSRPPAELKGRMIGTMNQANFVGILLSGPLYQGFEKISSSMGWPISSVFWMLAVLVIPLAIFYRLGSGKEK